jgi:RNA polymerase sigma-70 factor, ECF subfamily
VTTDEEANLIAALKLGDRLALGAIFRKYHSVLCRISFRILNDTDEAKDIAQQVFIKLWQNRNALSITYSLEAYLKKAALNASLNRIESKKRFEPLDSRSELLGPKAERIVENQQEANELQSQIDMAIGQLPTRTRAVFILIRFEGMSYKEAAETLVISSKAVEKEMLKALRILRELLRDYLNVFLLAAINSGCISFFF